MTDLYIAKLDPQAASLIFATFLGGACRDNAIDLQLGSDRSLYLSGQTYSYPFPTLDSLFEPPSSGLFKTFLAHLDATGSQLLFSTYLDYGANPRIAVAPNGTAYIAECSPNQYDPTQTLKGLLWKIVPIATPTAKHP